MAKKNQSPIKYWVIKKIFSSDYDYKLNWTEWMKPLVVRLELMNLFAKWSTADSNETRTLNTTHDTNDLK